MKPKFLRLCTFPIKTTQKNKNSHVKAVFIIYQLKIRLFFNLRNVNSDKLKFVFL